MQTTLLGVAIAFIIALVAALIGPHFIDWNQFRPQFEAEAARALGAPVRVDGLLDARLLPTPTLRLRSVTVGGAGDQGAIHADKLDVEFSLSALMRGEWRASELSLDGFSLAFGLDRQGRVEGPLSVNRFNLGSLAIDRLNLNGRVSLHDAASGATLDLDDLTFSGDVRALAGTMRGEGSFSVMGARTPFRVSSGQSADGKSTRVRFIADPGDRALFADLDGALSFDALAPKFDGALTLARTADPKSAASETAELPWRISSRLKADAAQATLEQIDVSVGAEDGALRLSGAGDMRFGASPLLHVAMSARQLDADRLLNKNAAEPLRVMTGLRRAVAALPPAPMLMQIEVAADQVALGGRPIQNLAVELHGDAGVWTVGKFEMRAPGATRIAATGMIASVGTDAGAFAGPLTLESSDPDTLFAWLQGRGDVAYRAQKPLRLRGSAIIAADRIGFDDLKADLDGGGLEGRVVLADLPDGKSRLDAALKADNFNFDAMSSFFSPLAASPSNWPGEAKISFDAGKAIFAGQEIRPVALEFSYAANAFSLDRLTFGDASTVALTGSGAFDRGAGSGKLSLNANASSLGKIASLIAPWAPTFAERLKAVDVPQGAARLQLSADLARAQDQPRGDVRAVLDIDAPQVKGAINVTSTLALDESRGIDLAALPRSEVNVETKLASDKAAAMLALLGVERIIAARDGPAQFESTLTGTWRSPFRVKARLSGAGFDGDVQGTADTWAEPPTANLDLAVRQADPSPLFDTKPASVAAVGLSSHLTISGKIFTFDNLDARVGGSRVRGRLGITRDEDTSVDGDLTIDTLDVAPAIAVALGAAGHEASEPLSRGALRGWRGSVAFQAMKVVLPGGSEVALLKGELKSDGTSLVLDGAKGIVGGGEVTVNADARQAADGTSINARIQVSGADGAALRHRSLAIPQGNASLLMSLATQGRSAAALTGALSGAGVVTLTDARVAGLDPRAFEAAVRASDGGQATDDASLKVIVEPALSDGELSVAMAQIPFTVRDGRLRVDPTPLAATGAGMTVSGGYDIAAHQADVRVVLSANVANPATDRPGIRVDWNGSPDALMRSIDVASLSSWLALRAIDRETRKLDQLDRGGAPVPDPKPMSLEGELPQAEPLPKSEVKMPNRDPRRRNPNAKSQPAAVLPSGAAPVAPPAAASVAVQPAPQVQPLPPAVTVKPAPGAMKLPKPRPPVVLTPQTSSF